MATSFFSRLGDSEFDLAPEGFRAEAALPAAAAPTPGTVPRGKELPFLRNSTPPPPLETGEFSALAPPLLPLRFMLLNMSRTAPTRLEPTLGPAVWGGAGFPLASFESFTWSRFSRLTGRGLGSGLGLSP